MAQNTNLNSSPYFDDFSTEKSYTKVLFKPGTPIQARELTTLQSILQDQVEKFGKHFFKEGEVVIPGNTAYDPDYTCVQIEPNHLGIDVSIYISNLVGKYIKGETSGVTAKVVNYITSEESENENFTLYVKYQSASDTNFSSSKFSDGENLISLQNVDYALGTIKSDSSFATSIVSQSTYTGSVVKIEEGVYFIRGFFVTVPSQTLILDQYSNLPNYRVGLIIDEEIATASQKYTDLFDNAKGFSNFAAPGADRLKITATLSKKSLDDFNDENFVELMRIVDGERQRIIKKTEEKNLIRDELARRTYDESGDYYVRPFDVYAKESLNNRLGNDGIYDKDQLTQQGNVPSDDLFGLQISPGKAYIRGYEVDIVNTNIIDVEKPRTTETVKDITVPFSLGNQVQLNNAFGIIPVGFSTETQALLYSKRTATPGTESGIQIGVARVYDLKLRDAAYVDASSVFEGSFFDIQTFNYLNLNTTYTVSAPAFVEGLNSGAQGYLYQDMTDTDQMILYQVSGAFLVNEGLKINGENASRSVSSIKDYSISDVKQIVTKSGLGTVTFTADPLISAPIPLAPQGSTFTITAGSGGISTVTTSSSTFGVGISTGDLFVYTKSQETLPTYNIVKSVNTASKSITIEASTSVSGVNNGSLPGSTITSTDLVKGIPFLSNTGETYFYTDLQHQNIASVDLSKAQLVYKKSYEVTVSANTLTSTLESDSNITLEPFDEEDYSLAYDDGTIEPLSSGQVTISGRTITLTGLSQNGGATLTATLRKRQLKSRKKIYNRSAVLNVTRSSNVSSGISSDTLGDGLTYSSVYGTRVQDRRISLNVPDANDVIGVFESSDTNEAQLPKLQITNLNANILNSIKGEIIYGESSQAIGVVVANNGNNQLEFVYQNENTFIETERLLFRESGLTADIQLVIKGDRNIVSDFAFESNQTEEIADISFIERNPEVTAPGHKLKIVYNYFYIDESDDGDFVTVSSYDSSVIKDLVPFVGNERGTDIIDLRPRVDPYDLSSTYSPFEYRSRSFSPETNSTPYTLSKDKDLFFSYSYYLGRIDVLYLNKSGEFFISSGIPSLEPISPDSVGTALEVATITMSPYVYNINEVEVKSTPHKRYRMQDIARIEDRLRNVEYYTSLSLLETETKNLTIRDSQTNLDRFKAGFFVDNFRSVESGLLGAPQHRCSIDTKEGLLRPQHYTTSIDLLLGSELIIGASNTPNPDADPRFVKDLGNPNTVKVGDVVCLKYSDVEFLKNTFATRSENVNPFHVVNWVGAIELNPATDTWVETRRSSRTVDQEGNYQSTIDTLGVDSNTGLSPITWGAWETTWTGTRETKREVLGKTLTGSRQVGQRRWMTNRRRKIRGRGFRRQQIVETTIRDSYIEFANVTTLTTTKQSRQGIQYKVGERFDYVSVGPKIISRDIIHTMRTRNIEFIAKRLKPKTRLYAFFDNVDMSKYVVPKLIEIEMNSGTFAIGETVSGTLGTTSIRFRLSKPNHKYGPYNAPTQVFVENPYNLQKVLPNTYSSTSTTLNVDTASLELQSSSGYYGHIVKNMQLRGETTEAIATVKEVRLVTDTAGTLIGSMFIPPATSQSTPTFETGTKTFVLTSDSKNSTIVGSSDSVADTKFTSSGSIDNVEELTLRIRNANVERVQRTEERTLTSEATVAVRGATTFTDRTVRQTRWVDPLAQSFEVPDETGVFITKVDVFFRTKDTQALPVTAQIRTMQTGLPTTTILPFGEVVLDPSEVSISEDGSIPTTFTFPSPVYLETGQSYCVVLLSASNEYTVWISRMGEEDITTLNKPESEKIVVSQQPLLGSLFKSQNGATWDPSQLEDLKLVVYRAKFFTGSSTVRFYNPDLDIGNNQVVALRNNPLDCYSRSVLVGLGKSLTSSEVSSLTSGVTILQENNTTFNGKLKSISGAIGIGSTLTITNAGLGFTSTFKTYSDVGLVSLIGRGSGAKVDISVQNGVAIAATVSVGGTGYVSGDTLEVDYSLTDSLGSGLVLTIPNNAGIISSFNSLIVDRVQGSLVQNSTDDVYYVSAGSTQSLPGANVNSVTTLSDGLHFKVSHNNHGMYSASDNVTLSGIEPDVKPETLNSSYNSTTTDSIVVSNIGIFTSFENYPVDSNNPGYVLIDKEVIQYTGFVTSTNSLTGITRKIDSTKPGVYSANTAVYKYELNGISLRRINTTHLLANTDSSSYPISIDDYHIKVGITSRGVDRSPGNALGIPELYFKEDKSCGSYDTIPTVGSSNGPKATQNIPFNQIRPNFQTLLPEGTSVSAKVRTMSGSTPDGNQVPFLDQGFVDVSLNSDNPLPSTRIICSKVNEETYLSALPGKKSFTMELTLNTSNEKISPMIDLDRINVITTSNRINSKISDFVNDFRVNSIDADPSAATYLSKIVRLQNPADNIKVFFDAYRHETNDIRLCYRIFRADSNPTEQLWELFPGFENLNANGVVIDPYKNNGKPDKRVLSSTLETDFKSYEFTASNLPQFVGFQLKIIMTGTDFAHVPYIRDLRAIATI